MFASDLSESGGRPVRDLVLSDEGRKYFIREVIVRNEGVSVLGKDVVPVKMFVEKFFQAVGQFQHVRDRDQFSDTELRAVFRAHTGVGHIFETSERRRAEIQKKSFRGGCPVKFFFRVFNVVCGRKRKTKFLRRGGDRMFRQRRKNLVKFESDKFFFHIHFPKLSNCL